MTIDGPPIPNGDKPLLPGDLVAASEPPNDDAAKTTSEKDSAQFIEIQPYSAKSIEALPLDLSLEQTATESLRIVADSRARRSYRWLPVIGNSLVLLLLAASTALLTTRYFWQLRFYLPQTPTPSVAGNIPPTQTRQTPTFPSPTIATQPAPTPQPLPIPQPTSRLLSLELGEFNAIDLKLLWFSAENMPALTAAQRKLQTLLAQQQWAQAETVYHDEVVPAFQACSRSLDNLARYNGWVLRWLTLLGVYETKPDPALLAQLTKEIELLELQSGLLLSSASSKALFDDLIRQMRQKLAVAKKE